jgi:riboflavin synthase
MFSGIVSHKSKVLKVETFSDFFRIHIATPKNFNKGLKKGASISVNGVCLTSKDTGSKNLKFDVIEETLLKTNLKHILKGDIVNLERSIKASSEIGGHLMSGHIHFTGEVKKIFQKENTKDMRISISKEYSDYILEKGYIGVNGCSLTLGKIFKNQFNIHLIPETLKITNLDKLEEKDLVNIEIDQATIAIVDTVKKTLAAQKS